MQPLSDWYTVTFDETHVRRHVRPPSGEPWQDSFAWSSIARVCYEPGEFLTSDTFHVFVNDRETSFAIPSEAEGAAELWGEIIRRGFFDAETSIKISTGELGLTCWPPIEG